MIFKVKLCEVKHYRINILMSWKEDYDKRRGHDSQFIIAQEPKRHMCSFPSVMQAVNDLKLSKLNTRVITLFIVNLERRFGALSLHIKGLYFLPVFQYHEEVIQKTTVFFTKKNIFIFNFMFPGKKKFLAVLAKKL